ncbi:MAG: toxic anion resistance protein, partial [Gammaproteobacteria bacterium]|nr:toxic anion resistance protein [Gammaproteobacteria bacterium]
MSEQQLAPPAVLEPPKPVEVVQPTKANEMVPLEPETIQGLDHKVASFVDSVITLEVESDEFKSRLSAIHDMGNKEVQAAAQVSNRMLDRPTRAMESGLFDENSKVSTSLVELRRVVEDLDPSRHGDLLSPRKFLGLFPIGNKLRDYFNKYRSSQSHINAIIEALGRSKEELIQDNTAIEQEKSTLWHTMGKLKEYIYLGQQIDQRLEARVNELEAQSPEKARVVREEMLFYVRQKVQDLLTQLA